METLLRVGREWGVHENMRGPLWEGSHKGPVISQRMP